MTPPDLGRLSMRVWFNLHRRDWSTRAVSGARVQPAAAVRLLDAVCHVNEAERQRVIARRCRSVHAWINGTAAKPVTEPTDFAAADAHRWHSNDLDFWREILTGKRRMVLTYWRHVFGCKSVRSDDGREWFIEKYVDVGEDRVWPPDGWVPPVSLAELDRLTATPPPLDHPGAVDPWRVQDD